jgi:hypothetical protein
MELKTDNHPTSDPTSDNPPADSVFADRVFADPVGYLAGHGIGSRLVSVTGVSIPKAA